MVAISTSSLPIKNASLPSFSSKPNHLLDNCPARFNVASLGKVSPSRQLVAVRSRAESGSNASIFISGFLLGGLIAGTLSCVYAPQISKALIGAGKKNMMKRLPEFVSDEGKSPKTMANSGKQT